MSIETKAKARPLFDPQIVRRAAFDALVKLNPRVQLRNPVMFVVEVTATLTTFLFVRDWLHGTHSGFAFQINLWLWFTLLFANFAEAVAEGRGKAQADALRRTRSDTIAKILADQASKIYSLAAYDVLGGNSRAVAQIRSASGDRTL